MNNLSWLGEQLSWCWIKKYGILCRRVTMIADSQLPPGRSEEVFEPWRLVLAGTLILGKLKSHLQRWHILWLSVYEFDWGTAGQGYVMDSQNRILRININFTWRCALNMLSYGWSLKMDNDQMLCKPLNLKVISPKATVDITCVTWGFPGSFSAHEF